MPASPMSPAAASSVTRRGSSCTWFSCRKRTSASNTDCDRSETGNTRFPRSVLSAQPYCSKKALASAGEKPARAL